MTVEHVTQVINRCKGKVTKIFITYQMCMGLQMNELVKIGLHAMHMKKEKN